MVQFVLFVGKKSQCNSTRCNDKKTHAEKALNLGKT